MTPADEEAIASAAIARMQRHYHDPAADREARAAVLALRGGPQQRAELAPALVVMWVPYQRRWRFSRVMFDRGEVTGSVQLAELASMERLTRGRIASGWAARCLERFDGGGYFLGRWRRLPGARTQVDAMLAVEHQAAELAAIPRLPLLAAIG